MLAALDRRVIRMSGRIVRDNASRPCRHVHLRPASILLNDCLNANHLVQSAPRPSVEPRQVNRLIGLLIGGEGVGGYLVEVEGGGPRRVSTPPTASRPPHSSIPSSNRQINTNLPEADCSSSSRTGWLPKRRPPPRGWCSHLVYVVPS